MGGLFDTWFETALKKEVARCVREDMSKAASDMEYLARNHADKKRPELAKAYRAAARAIRQWRPHQ